MRAKRKFKNIAMTIKGYEEEVTIITETSELNKRSGEFEKIPIKKIGKMAIFKKSAKYELKSRGAVKYADVKIYSLISLDVNDVVEHDESSYKIVSTEKRVECLPVVYVCYGELLDD